MFLSHSAESERPTSIASKVSLGHGYFSSRRWMQSHWIWDSSYSACNLKGRADLPYTRGKLRPNNHSQTVRWTSVKNKYINLATALILSLSVLPASAQTLRIPIPKRSHPTPV